MGRLWGNPKTEIAIGMNQTSPTNTSEKSSAKPASLQSHKAGLISEGQRSRQQTQTAQVNTPAVSRVCHDDSNFDTDAASPGSKSFSPLPQVHDGNENQKLEMASLPPASKQDAASLIAKVMHDLATGALRFALLGTSDGGIEIWRAAQDMSQRNKTGSHRQAESQEPAVTKIEPLVCNARTARQILGGMSPPSLWSLEKRGIIKRLPDFPRALYSIAHLREVVSKQTSKKTTQWNPVIS